MPHYVATLRDEEIQELKATIQKGGKDYHIKHAQIFLRLNHIPENETWTYDRISDAYGASHRIIARVANRFAMEGARGSLRQETAGKPLPQVTGDIEARICAIACVEPPVAASRWPCKPSRMG